MSIGRSLAYSYVRDGSLASIRLGRRRLIPVSAVDAFIARQLARDFAS
jgi:excisionase family DNA binding protein